VGARVLVGMIAAWISLLMVFSVRGSAMALVLLAIASLPSASILF
jgi:hypothetical protein